MRLSYHQGSPDVESFLSSLTKSWTLSINRKDRERKKRGSNVLVPGRRRHGLSVYCWRTSISVETASQPCPPKTVPLHSWRVRLQERDSCLMTDTHRNNPVIGEWQSWRRLPLDHLLSHSEEEPMNSNWYRREKIEVYKGTEWYGTQWMTPRGFPIPESNDRTLLADVALGLMLGSLRSGHSVQHGQPHHGLGLQSHPVQEEGSFDLRLIIGLRRQERSDGVWVGGGGGVGRKGDKAKEASVSSGNKLRERTKQ